MAVPLLTPLPIRRSLSRRFSLLRKSTGEPISLDDMRQRFVEQRAKGTPNTISEEEEEMLFEALSKMRTSAGFGRAVEGVDTSLKSMSSSTPYPASEYS